jgi:S1-C subfamily serine protease
LIESLLLTATRVSTLDGMRPLTTASGFFFQREHRLFLVTSRHVVFDRPSGHFPDRLEIELHTDKQNMTRSAVFSIPLYSNGLGVWRQGLDSAGEVDVAVIELMRAAMPQATVLRAFTPQHLQADSGAGIGASLLVLGFPLGFYDTLHHLPVARHAVVASSFGTRFQGEGYFLTDARTHRGTSGAPVVMRRKASSGDDLPWALLGVHSARLDMGTRDTVQDESLGLNSAWYADILLTLTDQNAPAAALSSPVTK